MFSFRRKTRRLDNLYEVTILTPSAVDRNRKEGRQHNEGIIIHLHKIINKHNSYDLLFFLTKKHMEIGMVIDSGDLVSN